MKMKKIAVSVILLSVLVGCGMARHREQIRTGLLTKIPLKRIAAIEEVAPAAVFLASDFASMITGAIFPIDGGWTCQ